MLPFGNIVSIHCQVVCVLGLATPEWCVEWSFFEHSHQRVVRSMLLIHMSPGTGDTQDFTFS